MPRALRLVLQEERLAICRLPPDGSLPDWFPGRGPIASMTLTEEELSLVVNDADLPAGVSAQRGWRAFKVLGPLDFALTGVLATLSGALAQAGISLFALSTFDTDYILVREGDVPAARRALRSAGDSAWPIELLE
jgi:hypothetical protein